MRYEHHCNGCGIDWAEEYSIKEDPPSTCPECASRDVYRHIGCPAFTLKGAGWASDGYHKNAPLETWKGKLKLYDRKDDYVREAVGEEEARMTRQLRAQNEAIKRTLGVDATIGEREAKMKINEAGEKKRNEV